MAAGTVERKASNPKNLEAALGRLREILWTHPAMLRRDQPSSFRGVVKLVSILHPTASERLRHRFKENHPVNWQACFSQNVPAPNKRFGKADTAFRL